MKLPLPSGCWRVHAFFACLCLGSYSDAKEPYRAVVKPEIVGRLTETSYLTPTNQVLTPAGRQVNLPGTRPQTLALSPDGAILVTAGRAGELIVIDPATGNILQNSAPLAEKESPGARPRSESQLGVEAGVPASFTGLAFSPDGSRIYLSVVSGGVRVFSVDKTHAVTAVGTFSVPDAGAPGRKAEIPAGLVVSQDGKRLYAACNLGNRLAELDAESGAQLRTWNTGVAPYDVVLASGKAYVSNSGGRRPGAGDLTGPAGRGTTVRVDAERTIASEGSVTVIDLASSVVKSEVLAGLHASAMAPSPDGRYVVVANTGSDTLTVIDTKTDTIAEKIWTRQTPGDLFGAQPNALAFDRSGKRLFVCNGTQNAVAVVRFEPGEKESSLLGMIPVGWFPGAVQFDAVRKAIYVANIKGIGATKAFKPDEKVKLSSKDFFGTISLVPAPSEEELTAMTVIALQNMRYPKLAEAKLPPRPGQPPRPVPERVGEPSVFRHVIYVIKENRSYDQVLGDMKEGNGDASLCAFGEEFTPNQHKIAREFVLLDNAYCSGVQSADGHQWTDSAIANAYMERQVTSAFPRSYPGGKTEDGVDALAWASSGFIWDNAIAHGKSFRNYGEWMLSEAGWKDKTRKGKPRWMDYWNDYKSSAGLTQLASRPGIEALRKYSKLDGVGWDLNVPDVMRAAAFIKELKQFERQGGFPDFMIVFLPNDHTGGTRPQTPAPGAAVADNDLALGQMVEALSHGKFWRDTCLFAIEDDPQNGWDHVSGYRTTCYLASAYTKRRQTISAAFNQTSLMRTMELILGLPPMNQLDATATPMSDCFTEDLDMTPFDSVPNRTPLDQLNPDPKKISDRVLRSDAFASSRFRLDEPDRCPEEVLNRILWHAMKGPQIPFPKWAVTIAKDND